MTSNNKTNKARINAKQTARSKQSTSGTDLALKTKTGIKTKGNQAARCKAGDEERRAMPFVLDMLYCKTPLLQNSAPTSDSKSGDGDINIGESAAFALVKKLSKAAKKADVTFSAKMPLHNSIETVIQTRFRARVKEFPDPGATKNYAVFDIYLEWIRGSATRIKVSLSRNAVEKATAYSIAIQANPTSLLSGQNAWPMNRVSDSLREDLALQFGFPCIVLIALLKEVDETFVAPTALTDYFLKGRALLENVQFAIYADVKSEHKQIVLESLEAAFQPRRVSFSGGQYDTHLIGKWLGVEARCIAKSDVTETTLLHKMSGTHKKSSLSVYDKGWERGLSASRAEVSGFKDRLRLDFTFQARGISQIISDAAKIAKNQEPKLTTTFGKMNEHHSAADLIEAISIIDLHYCAKIDGQTRHGFAAWLVQEILYGEYRLEELFSHSNAKRDQLDAHFAKLGKKDKRYANGYARWYEPGAESDRKLRDCLKAEGLKKPSLDRCMRQVRALGVSGFVSPRYFSERKGASLLDGLSHKDHDVCLERIEAGKAANHLVERGRENMEPAFAAVRRMTTSAADQSGVPMKEMPMRAVKATRPKKITRVEPRWLLSQSHQPRSFPKVKPNWLTRRKEYA